MPGTAWPETSTRPSWKPDRGDPLSGAIDKAHVLMAGQVRGRVVVRIGG
ncbi:MAG: hypothetical protein IPG16_10835 [Comamonadaceae bacterium]|nr:hypothetical protein [Comamonadaceae bacterium]